VILLIRFSEPEVNHMPKYITQRYCNIDPVQTGLKIRICIEASDIRIKDLAGIMSVSQQSVYKWLKGESLPSLDNMVLLCSILNVSIDSVIVRSTVYEYEIEEIYLREEKEYLYYTASSDRSDSS
jgi:transcriptional regulator with XRE-family HTH domain